MNRADTEYRKDIIPRTEVLRMAQEAGFLPQANPVMPQLLERFAALVASAAQAKEREACAKVCDELHWPWHMGDNSGPKECAAAIRARGQA